MDFNKNNILFFKINTGNEENEEKLALFLKEFLKNFCELMLFSSILLQEAKELESVKDILLACNEKAHIDLFNLKDEFEDLKLERNAEKRVKLTKILFFLIIFYVKMQLKEFLSAKGKELEKKIHESDSMLYKHNETINV